MNPKDQKARHQIVHDLDRRLSGELQAVREDQATLDGRIAARLDLQAERIDGLARSLADAHERRGVLDARVRDFIRAGFWARLRWLVLGPRS